MPDNEESKIGDLTKLNDDIEEVFEKHGHGRPAMVICFQRENDKTAHYVANVTRTDMVKMMKSLLEYILMRSN